jgi:hypothetical protein
MIVIRFYHHHSRSQAFFRIFVAVFRSLSEGLDQLPLELVKVVVDDYFYN